MERNQTLSSDWRSGIAWHRHSVECACARPHVKRGDHEKRKGASACAISYVRGVGGWWWNFSTIYLLPLQFSMPYHRATCVQSLNFAYIRLTFFDSLPFAQSFLLYSIASHCTHCAFLLVFAAFQHFLTFRSMPLFLPFFCSLPIIKYFYYKF